MGFMRGYPAGRRLWAPPGHFVGGPVAGQSARVGVRGQLDAAEAGRGQGGREFARLSQEALANFVAADDEVNTQAAGRE